MIGDVLTLVNGYAQLW